MAVELHFKQYLARLQREWAALFREPPTSDVAPLIPPLIIEVVVLPRVAPPKNAELFLSSLLRGDEREAAVGDLVERYQKVYHRLGKRRANLWFWGEVLWSLGPLVKRLIVSGGLIVLAQWLKKLIS